MTLEQHIKELITLGESQTTEFKTSFGQECVQTLSALANSGGVTLLVGISDSGEVLGVAAGTETIQNWVNTIKQSTAPSIIDCCLYFNA